MDCSTPGFSVHGFLQARILEWISMSFSRGSSRPRDRTYVSCLLHWQDRICVIHTKHIEVFASIWRKDIIMNIKCSQAVSTQKFQWEKILGHEKWASEGCLQVRRGLGVASAYVPSSLCAGNPGVHIAEKSWRGNLRKLNQAPCPLEKHALCREVLFESLRANITKESVRLWEMP